MVRPPLSDLTLVDAVRVRVTLEGPDGLDEMYLLDLDLVDPAPSQDDATYLSALSPVVEKMDTPEGCIVRIGREHRLGARSVSVLDVDVWLPRPTVQFDETDPTGRSTQHEALEAAVGGRLPVRHRRVPLAPTIELGHDEALALARRRVAEASPDAGATGLSVTAEEHANEHGRCAWPTRHPPRTRSAGASPTVIPAPRVRRIRTREVFDSVGAE